MIIINKPIVTLKQYTDPQRTELADIAAVYMQKKDNDNIKRPLRLIEMGHDSFLKSQFARFHYKTSLATYMHLATYTLQTGAPPFELRASQSLRASKPDDCMLPSDAKDAPLVMEAILQNAETYQRLIEKGEKPQTARYAAPQGLIVEYTISWSFLLLGKHFFVDRLWSPGAMPETKEIAQQMFDLVVDKDRDLWYAIYKSNGTPVLKEKQVMNRLEKSKLTIQEFIEQVNSSDPWAKNVTLYEALMSFYGEQTSSWE